MTEIPVEAEVAEEAEVPYIRLPVEEVTAVAEEVFNKENSKYTNGMSLLETSRLLYL
jgi:hypothetical protein